MDMNFIQLEDGKECIILDEFNHKGSTYVILVNTKNRNDFTIREVVQDKLIGLENEQQLNNVLMEYVTRKGNKNE